MTTFRRYDHVERYGHSNVRGIECGEVHVFPKLDGTNGSLWWDSPGGEVRCGSRNRTIDVDDDNQGFARWAAENNEKLSAFFRENPELTIYGEWLVPHTIKSYRPEAWRRFYVFDVFDHRPMLYLPHELYAAMLDQWEIEYIPPICTIDHPSDEELQAQVELNHFLMQDGASPGEGIVIKNYSWNNRYGRQPWAKIVRNEFREKNTALVGAPKKKGAKTPEREIVKRYVTPEFVGKTRSKVVVDTANRHGIALQTEASEPHLHTHKQVEEDYRSEVIPQFLGRVFHDLIEEESWAFVKRFKKPTINFQRLESLTVARCKELACDLF